jgi:hypothetical protein
MKKVISTMLAVIAFATAAFAYTENFTIYDYPRIDPNNEIETYVNYASNSTVYVSITNGVDVDIMIEFDPGFSGTTGTWIVNNSTNTGVGIGVQNFNDYGRFNLDHLPPGAYTISVGGQSSTFTSVYYY